MEKLPNLGISLRIEERNRMTSRTLKSNMLSYSGPELKISNISVPREIRYLYQLKSNALEVRESDSRDSVVR